MTDEERTREITLAIYAAVHDVPKQVGLKRTDAIILSLIGEVRAQERAQWVELEAMTSVRTYKDIPESKRYCGFCAQGDKEIGLENLVEGPITCICGQCAETAVAVINERASEAHSR